MGELRLVENYVISCYNHHARGVYNIAALIFKQGGRRPSPALFSKWPMRHFLMFLNKQQIK